MWWDTRRENDEQVSVLCSVPNASFCTDALPNSTFMLKYKIAKLVNQVSPP